MSSVEKNKYFLGKDTITDPLVKLMVEKGAIPHDQNVILYKYMPLSIAKIVLRNGTVRFSSPSKFKDTFELDMSGIDFDFRLEDMKDRLEQAWGRKHPDKVGKMPAYSKGEIEIAYRQMLIDQRMNALIFCLSNTSTNRHLWDKYGDKGRGVCIGFYMPFYYEPWNMFTMHVQYDDQPAPFQLFHNDFAVWATDMARWVSTKRKCWEQEEEVRCFNPNMETQFPLPTSGVVDMRFNPSQLKEIYFGPKMRTEDVKMLRKILRTKGYVYEKNERVKLS